MMRINLQNGQQYSSSPAGFFTRIVVMTLAVILVDWLLPGVHVSNLTTAIITAVVISLLNNFLRPILIVLTLPFTVLSMGLFLFVVNAIIIALASAMVKGFNVDGFGNALLFSLLLTGVNYLLELPNKLRSRETYQENPSDTTIHSQQLPTDNEDYTPYEEVSDDDDN